MFGSLIFCLPTEFSGGELIIRSPDLSSSVTHDWGSSSTDRLAAASTAGSSSGQAGSSHGKVAWAAMYSDCEHEIKPVTTGHRVTITYNLYRTWQVCSRALWYSPAALETSFRNLETFFHS